MEYLLNLFLKYAPNNWYLYLIALISIDIFMPKIFGLLAVYVDKSYRSKKYIWFSKLVKSMFCMYLYILNYVFGFILCYLVVWYFKLNKFFYISIFETSVILTFILSLIFILLFLLPFGDWRYKVINTRRLTIDENNRISSILYNKFNINESLQVINRIKYRVVNEEECNAFTLGRKTVVFTRGLLQILNDDELAGIMAHEFAHLINNDNIKFSLYQGMSFFFRLYCEIVNMLRDMIKAIIESMEIMIVFLWPFSIPLAILNYINQQINKPVDILLKTFNRHQEYVADDFAVKAGLKENLINALEKIDDSEFHDLFTSLRNSHPTLEFRVEVLKHGYFIQ